VSNVGGLHAQCPSAAVAHTRIDPIRCESQCQISDSQDPTQFQYRVVTESLVVPVWGKMSVAGVSY
jgi:hypothetical protein